MCLLRFNYCKSFHAIFAFCIVFVLKLQTDVAALQMSLPLNKFAQPCFSVFER